MRGGTVPTALTEAPAASRGVSSEDFREAMTHFATSVAVVTTHDGRRPVGCTVTAVMPLSDTPPTMAVSLITGSSTLGHILDSGRFAINILQWHQRHLVQQFASGAAERRFDGVEYCDDQGAPVLAEAMTSMVCELTQSVPLLDHTLLIGGVDVAVSGDAGPLVLYRRDGHRLTTSDCARCETGPVPTPGAQGRSPGPGRAGPMP